MPVSAPARGARGPANVPSGDPLRDNFFKLFTRSFVRAEKMRAGLGREVYRGAAAMTLDMCGQSWAQATVFLEDARLAQQFLAVTGIEVKDRKKFIQFALMANAWAFAWTSIFLGLDARGFRHYCRAHGFQRLRSAIDEKRGVILVHSHTVFTQLFWRWLEHQKIPTGITLWQWTWNRERNEKDDPKLRTIESAKEMHAAVRLLKEGGLVHSLADGRWGNDKFSFRFFGRQRVFQSSFAELACLSGATVLPVDVVLEPNGRILIEIGEPFIAGTKEKDRNKRVGALVGEYVEHLTRRWRRHPDNIEWFQVRRHLALPALETGK